MSTIVYESTRSSINALYILVIIRIIRKSEQKVRLFLFMVPNGRSKTTSKSKEMVSNKLTN